MNLVFIALQRNDIAMAITKYDQFDFLIDIVPREEVKPARVKEEGRSVLGGLPTDQVCRSQAISIIRC